MSTHIMSNPCDFKTEMYKLKFGSSCPLLQICKACGLDWGHHSNWHCTVDVGLICTKWHPTEKQLTAMLSLPEHGIWCDQYFVKFGTPTPWMSHDYNCTTICKVCKRCYCKHVYAQCPGGTSKQAKPIERGEWPMDYTPHTQKANGILALIETGFAVPSVKSIFPVSATKLPKISFPVFARPCPILSRHGFVPSRVVKDSLALAALVSETADAEADAELVCMTPIAATYNAILTPNTLTVGPGNSGATGGERAIVVPVGSGANIEQKTMDKAGVKDTPYVELVYASECVYFTQLRDGIPVPLVKDVVPHKDYKVSKVIEALPQHREDLLGWERLMHAAPKGTAIYAPGFPLACHIGVHARMNNFACITSGRRPKVGDILQPVEEVPEENPALAQQGAALLLGPVSREPLELLRFGFAGVHNSVWWLGRCDKVLGASLAALARAALTLCAGEARFEDSARQADKLSRKEAYKQALHTQITPAKAAKIRTIHLEGKFGGGFGGIKWACIAHAAIRVLAALEAGNLRNAVEIANVLVHLEHNGGWAFNKVCNGAELDLAASHPGQTAAMVAPTIYRALTCRSRRVLTGWRDVAESTQLDKALVQAAKQAALVKKQVKVHSVETLAVFLKEFGDDEIVLAQVRPMLDEEGEGTGKIRVQVKLDGGTQFEFTFAAPLPSILCGGCNKSLFSGLHAYSFLNVKALKEGKLCLK